MPVDDIDDYEESMDEFDDQINGKRRSSRRSRASTKAKAKTKNKAKPRKRSNRTHRGRNARPVAAARKEKEAITQVLGQDIKKSKEFRQFKNNINKSLEDISDNVHNEIENVSDDFVDIYKDTIDKSLDLYQQFNKAQSKITKKSLASNLKICSKVLQILSRIWIKKLMRHS